MATYVKKSGGSGRIILVLIFLFVIAGLIWFAFLTYKQLKEAAESPVTQDDVQALNERLDDLDKRVEARERNEQVFEWWSVAKWLLVIGSVTFLLWYLIKRYYDKKNDRLTIDAALEKGTVELLEKHNFETVRKFGSSLQRREGSENRVLLLTFSRLPSRLGMRGYHAGLMYCAVVDDNWEHRYWSLPGMTFRQFMDELHDLEVIGFSTEKSPELAGLLKLQEQAEAGKALGDLGKELGFEDGTGG